jgi:hypothetical protein
VCVVYKKIGLNITFPIEYRHINTRHCERFSIAHITVLFSSLHGLVVKCIGKDKNYRLSVPLDLKKK